jgi:hypothetical protein
MNLFSLTGGRVTFSPEALLIKEFKDLWDRDSSKTKEAAAEDLAYVYYLTDYKSVYKAYDDHARHTKIAADIITRKSWKPDKLIEEAVEKYRELQTTPSMGTLDDVEAALTKIRMYFRNIDVTDDDTGKKTQTLIANVKSIGDLIKGITSLRELVEKEISETQRIKGQGRLGMRETPKR